MRFRLLVAATVVSALAACGGGAEPGPPNSEQPLSQPVLVTELAAFKISGARVYAFDSEGRPTAPGYRLTDADGRFTVPANTYYVDIKVGDVKLNNKQINPKAEPSGAWSIPNYFQSTYGWTLLPGFLMLVDDDGNPTNGIQVSAATDAAAHSLGFDFNRSPANFLSDPVTISRARALSATTSAGTRDFPTVADAEAAFWTAWHRDYMVGQWSFTFDQSYAAAPGVLGMNATIDDSGVLHLSQFECSGLVNSVRGTDYVNGTVVGRLAVRGNSTNCTGPFIYDWSPGNGLTQSGKARGTLEVVNPSTRVRSTVWFTAEKVRG